MRNSLGIALLVIGILLGGAIGYYSAPPSTPTQTTVAPGGVGPEKRDKPVLERKITVETDSKIDKPNPFNQDIKLSLNFYLNWDGTAWVGWGFHSVRTISPPASGLPTETVLEENVLQVTNVKVSGKNLTITAKSIQSNLPERLGSEFTISGRDEGFYSPITLTVANTNIVMSATGNVIIKQ